VRRTLAIFAAIAVVTLVSGLVWWRFAPRRTPGGQPPLATLDAASLSAFRDAFNAAGGEIRIVALLSPT
jgi:hypothetical protein